ncbi:MAG: hypothetical protein OHK0036_00200 [Bacteroidia bacterium]
MINKIITNQFKIFKNIPIVVLNKEIVYINNPAKSLLHYTSQNKQKLYQEIINAIKNKKFHIEIKYKNKITSIALQCDTLLINNEKLHFCILNNISEIFEYKDDLEKKLSLYEEMFDNLPIGILIHENGLTKYINQYGMKVLQSKSKKEYLNFPILNFLIKDKDKQRAIKRIQSTKNYLPPELYEIKTFKGNHKVVELYSYFFPYIYKDKKNIVRLLVFTDKTEDLEKQKLEVESLIKERENTLLKKQNQIKEKLLDELKTKQEQLFNTINNSDYLFWITDVKLNIVIFNQKFYEYCKKYYNVDIKIGENTLKLQDKFNKTEIESKKIREEIIEKLKNTKEEITYEISHFDKSEKKTKYFKMTFKPIFGKNKTIKHYYCYGHEITEKYEFLNQIEQQTIKLHEIIEHSPIYLWSLNKNFEITLFNENYAQLIQKLYGEKPIIGKPLSKGKYSAHQDLINTLNYHYEKAFNGSQENFKMNFDLENDRKITLDVNLFPIIVNNHIKEVSGIATDITQEVEKQNQLKTLLHENEVLMKEIHHRIKNNLQVISSMINLQIQDEENQHTRYVLRDTQNRVYSMAIIHQTLYQNRNYSSINISGNIPTLIQNILFSFNRSDIDVFTDIEEVILDVNTAIPLFLIINEAVTNIVKYAFPLSFQGEKKSEIYLKRKNTNIEVIIKDNGTGIQKNTLENIFSSTGFSIIKALSEQINAQLNITSAPNQGTELKLLVPLI